MPLSLREKFSSNLFAGVLLIVASLITPKSADATQFASYVTSLKEIRERGVVMQKWENSCAAAALATVLTYGFGDPVSEKYIVSKMLEKTSPEKVKSQRGFSLFDMRQFAVDRGYQADAYKDLSIADVSIMHAPIALIDEYGFNHFVVLNGVIGDKVLLADPAFGNRTVSIEKFLKIWIDGVAIVISR